MRYEKTYRRAIREIRKSTISGVKSPKQAGVPRLLVAVGLGTSGLIAVSLFGLPKRAEANSIDRVMDVLGQTVRYHITTKFRGVVYSEKWADGSRLRSRATIPGVQVLSNKAHVMRPQSREAAVTFDNGFDGRRFWSVDQQRRVATIHTETPTFLRMDKSVRVDDLIKAWKSYWHVPLNSTQSSVGDTTVITVTKPDGTMRLRITADRSGFRPLLVEYLTMVNKDWVANSTDTYEYPESIPSETFEFRPPADYSVYDYDQVLARVTSGLKGHGQTATAAGITVNLGGAVQEPNGWLNVYWSGGGVPPVFAEAGAIEADGTHRFVDFLYEGDDRNRPKNNGIPPKVKPKPVPPHKMVVELRPMSYVDGKPFYCLRVWTRPLDRVTDTGQASDSAQRNTPRRLKITLPVCKQVSPYVQKPGEKWLPHRMSGRQVGTVSFDVTSVPVGDGFQILRWIDPKVMPIRASYPAKQAGLSKEEAENLQRELFKRPGN